MGDYDFESPPTSDTTGNLHSIPDLLTSDSLPNNIGSNPAERPRIAKWDTDSTILLGRWLLKQLESRDVATIKKEHFKRLNILDIGPSGSLIPEIITGGILQLRVLIQNASSEELPRKKIDWSLGRWQQFAYKAQQSLEGEPRRLTLDEFNAVSKKLRGPSRRQLRSFGVNRLNELLGYEQEWDAISIVEWGARVIMANPNIKQPLGHYCLVALSNRGDGPSPTTILNHLGSRQAFRQQAQEYYEEIAHEDEERQEWQQQRLDRFNQIVVETDNSKKPLDAMTNEEKVAFAARYDIALKLLSSERKGRAWAISKRGGRTFTSALCKLEPGLTEGKIEVQAEQMGLLDDIWPVETDLSKLQLTEEAVEAVRLKYKTARERGKERMQSSSSPIQASNTLPAGISISDVRNGVDNSIEIGQQAIGYLEQAARDLEATLQQLTISTEGSSQQDIEQVMATLQECQRQIDYIKGQLGTAVEHSQTVRNYL